MMAKKGTDEETGKINYHVCMYWEVGRGKIKGDGIARLDLRFRLDLNAKVDCSRMPC
jgi:hypothetical protein